MAAQFYSFPNFLFFGSFFLLFFLLLENFKTANLVWYQRLDGRQNTPRPANYVCVSKVWASVLAYFAFKKSTILTMDGSRHRLRSVLLEEGASENHLVTSDCLDTYEVQRRLL